MFELSVAKKYLTPRFRQLSVSIISLISILVISLVVWLIVVFFSVTNGLEKGWVEKLTALTAPVRITPKDAYYQSYYYLIDSISANSDYTSKTIKEKLAADKTNPYDPSSDEELPVFFAVPDLNSDGTLKDLIKQAYAKLHNLNADKDLAENIQLEDYEVTMSHLKVTLERNTSSNPVISHISQATYLGSYDKENKFLSKTLIPLSKADVDNVNRHYGLQDNLKVFQKKTLQIENEEGILLPKTFKDAGVLVGDQSSISYYTPTLSAIQEQQVPVYVAGFYDPGLIPIGGKFVLANSELVSLIRLSQADEQSTNSAGINIRFENLDKANLIKAKIEQGFKAEGLDPYFKVETYKEYDFTKDLLQQLQSDKTLFSLISAIIILVACSNIISMLIIMVNDKKVEIGILRSMGTTSLSIAFIFGLCGTIMGLIGSVIGTIAAYFTLKNMNVLIEFLSKLQGHNAFNPLFYGDTLPNEISFEAMLFVVVSTAIISLIAGVVPAIKATTLRPSAILRSE